MISIIIPVYKAEKYLHRCIDSILAQTYKDWELLLIDDGSPDNSGTICDEYAKNDSRFKVIHKKNGGASSARNAGLDYAVGEWICFVDADDSIEKDYLFELIDNSEGSDIVISGFRMHKDNYTTDYRHKKARYRLDSEPKLFFSEFRFRGMGGPYCKLYKNKIIKHGVRFCEEMVYAEDLDFFLQYLSFCKDINVLDGANYNYIICEGSITSRIYPYNIELKGLQRIVSNWDKLYSKFSINKDTSYRDFYNNVLMQRVLLSIYQSNYTSDVKLKYLRLIDERNMKIFTTSRKVASVRERMIKYILSLKMYKIADLAIKYIYIDSLCKKV